MINIAVCDDDRSVFKDISHLLKSENMDSDFKLIYFKNATQLFDCIRKKEIIFQILFMDIELGGISGIEVVKEIQKNYTDSPYVVFITSFPDYVFSVFEVSTTDFISKPISGEKLKSTLYRIKKKLDTFESPFVLVKDRYTKENIFILQKEIIYVEMENSAKRLLKVVTTEETIYAYSRLGDFMEGLQMNLFAQVYRSIYVNLDHIISFKKKSIKVTDQSILPIGIKYGFSLTERFMNSIREDTLI